MFTLSVVSVYETSAADAGQLSKETEQDYLCVRSLADPTWEAPSECSTPFMSTWLFISCTTLLFVPQRVINSIYTAPLEFKKEFPTFTSHLSPWLSFPWSLQAITIQVKNSRLKSEVTLKVGFLVPQSSAFFRR